MLRMIVSLNAEQAKSYYTAGLSQEDYYSEGQEIAGRWGGKGAALLGLVGAVDKESFFALAENRHPVTGGKLTPRQDANRRVGYDMNFHCPKSLSLLYALNKDEGILEAFQQSVRETMHQMEAEMKTRVRRAGMQEDRITGNMVWGEFVHFTARPVDGKPDPHLHAHVFAMNATFDAEEDRWKAGQFGDLKRDAPYYEAAFHARLAKRIRDLGYEVERTKKGWEVAGVSRELNEKFSQRTALINKKAEELGITDQRQLDNLGASTREKKVKDKTLSSLQEEWESRLSEEDESALQRIAEEKGKHPERTYTAREAMDWALAHSFERASVVPEKRVMEAALERGLGFVTVEEIQRELEREEIIRGNLEGIAQCTTKAVLAEERRLLEDVQNSRGTLKPLGYNEARFQDTQLSSEQHAAAKHVLESYDGVVGIRGAAGTGKTTMMRETIAAIKEGGKDVFVFAPSAEASRGVLRAEGFENAETVAKLLMDQELKQAVANQVIWVDEAGLLGTRQMMQVVALAKEQNARLILSGDTRQHRAVERGDSLRLLEDRAGLSVAQLGTIRRQQGTYREAIQAFSEKRIVEGFVKLEELGAIHEARDVERDAELAEDYLGILKKGESVLIVSPTHSEGQRITKKIRDVLREEGHLGSKEDQQVVPTFQNLNFTDAEKSDPASYTKGMLIEFRLNSKDHKMGERWWVKDVQQEEERVLITKDDKEVELPLDKGRSFDVVMVQQMELSPGDLLRVQRNGVSKGGNRLHNGQLYQVKEFTQEGDIVLNNGWKVPRDFGYMSHGYVMTSHASQGRTVDHVLISQGMESWGAANREQFYVSASRGKKSVKIYTDNRDELLESVLGTSDRASAHDLLGPLESKQALQDIVHQERERIIGHKEDLVIPPSFEQIELHLPEAENPAIIPSEMPIPKPPLPNVPFANAPFAKGSVAPSPQPWQSKATPKISPSPIGKSEGNEPAPSKEKESEKAPSSIPFTEPLPNIGFPYHSVTFSPVSYQEPKEEKPKSIPEKPIAPPKVQEPPKEDSRFDRVQKLIAKYNGQSIESKPLTEEQRQRRFDAYMKQTGIDVRKSKEQTKQPDKERGE